MPDWMLKFFLGLFTVSVWIEGQFLFFLQYFDSFLNSSKLSSFPLRSFRHGRVSLASHAFTVKLPRTYHLSEKRLRCQVEVATRSKSEWSRGAREGTDRQPVPLPKDAERLIHYSFLFTDDDGRKEKGSHTRTYLHLLLSMYISKILAKGKRHKR